MATTTLTSATPYENTSDEVDRWELQVVYTQGTEGTSDYYESNFTIILSIAASELNKNNLIKIQNSNTKILFNLYI